MISNQCLTTVKKIVENMGIDTISIEPGQIEIKQPVDDAGREKFRFELKKAGFTLIDDTDHGRVNQIKSYIIRLVHYRKGEKIDVFFSRYLSKEIGEPYPILKKLFLSIEGEPIGNYVAREKIKRAKKLLAEDRSKYNITDISIDLGYHSPGHLCAQFKKVTGVTLTSYQSVGMQDRKNFRSY